MSDAENKVTDAHAPAPDVAPPTPPSFTANVLATFSAARPLAPTDLALFAELLVGLVRARLPLPDALKLLAKDADTPRLKTALEAVERDVASGTSLPDALRKREGEFPRLFTALIEQGVHTNDLHAALVELVREYRSQQRFREALWSQLLSPLATAVVCGLFIILIAASQLPTLYLDIYKHLRVDLPMPTKMLLAVCTVLRDPRTGAIAAVAVVLTGIFCAILARRTRARRNFQMFALSLPVIGPFLKTALLGRFSRILSILLHRRIPLDASLSLARESFSFLPMQDAIDLALQRVRNGTPLDEALSACPLFPATIVQFVRSGQLHGELPETLARLADLYEQRGAVDGARLRAAIFIFAQIFVGVVVGGLVLAFFAPFIRIQDHIRSK